MSSQVNQPRSQAGSRPAGSVRGDVDNSNIERKATPLQSSPSRGKLPSRGAVTVTSLQDALRMNNLPGKGQNFSAQEHGLNLTAKQSKSGTYFNRNQYMEDMAVDAEFIEAEDLLRQKQEHLIANPQVKSSMTTNIKSIMQNQDKMLLATSARLLSSQVSMKELEKASDVHQRELQKHQKKLDRPVSTIDLLSQHQMTKYEPAQSQRNLESREQNLPALHPSASLPQLPLRSNKQAFVEGYDGGQDFSVRDEGVSEKSNPVIGRKMMRPSSTILLSTVGDSENKSRMSKRIDVQNARSRDTKQSAKHTYMQPKPSANSRMQRSNQAKEVFSKVTSSGNLAQPRIPPIPLRVSYQNALTKEENKISPFMLEQQIQPEILFEPSIEFEHVQKRKGEKPPSLVTPKEKAGFMKYSSSVTQLKTMNKAESLASMKAVEVGATPTRNALPPLSQSKNTAQFFKQRIKKIEGNAPRPATTFYTPDESFDSAYSRIKQFSQLDIFKQNDLEMPTNEMIKLNNETHNKKFLPIEAFDPWIDIEDPAELIQKYKDQATGQTPALTKFNYANGEASLRKCTVQQYLQKEDLFVISWCHKPTSQKKVARFNLIFELEDHLAFKTRCEEASHYRQTAEILMKFQHMVDKIKLTIPGQATSFASKQTSSAVVKGEKEKNPVPSDQTKTTISYMISTFDSHKNTVLARPIKNQLQYLALTPSQRYNVKFFPRWQEYDETPKADLIMDIHNALQARGYSLQLLQHLFKELDRDFVQTHKRILFEMQVPYNNNCISLFSQILPPIKLIPFQERVLVESEPRDLALIPITQGFEERSLKFPEQLTFASRRAHIAHPKKLKIIQNVRVQTEKIEQARFMNFLYDRDAHSKDVFFKVMGEKQSQLYQSCMDGIFDTAYEIEALVQEKVKEIENLNNERKQSMTFNVQAFQAIPIPEDFIDDMRRYQRLIQIKYENAIRSVFIYTLDSYETQLHSVWDLVMRSVRKDRKLSQTFNKESKTPLVNIQVGDIESDDFKLYSSNLQEYLFLEDDINTMSRDAVLASRISRAQTLQLRCRVHYDKDQKEFIINPDPIVWQQDVIKFVWKVLDELDEIRCLDVSKLGQVRKNGHIEVFMEEDNYVQESLSRIEALMQKIFGIPKALIAAVSQFTYVLSTKMEKWKKDLTQKATSYELQDFVELLEENDRTKAHIRQLLLPESVSQLQLGPFHIEVKRVKDAMMAKIGERYKIIEGCVRLRIQHLNNCIEEDVEEHIRVITSEDWENIEQLKEVKDYISDLENKRLKLEAMQVRINHLYTLLARYNMGDEKSIPGSLFAYWSTWKRPNDIQDAVGSCLQRIDKEEKRFSDDLEKMMEKLDNEKKEIMLDFDLIQKYEDLSLYDNAYKNCRELKWKIEDAQATAKVVKRRQLIFKQKPEDYTAVDKIQKEFDPHYELWKSARNYYDKEQMWRSGSIADPIMDTLTQDITSQASAATRLEKKTFKEKAETSHIASELRQLYEGFKPYLPLVKALKNKHMNGHYFQKIRALREPPFDLKEDLRQSIQDLVDLGVMELLEEIKDLSHTATLERKLDEQIQDMREAWKSEFFEMQEYKDSGVNILTGIQPIWDKLDDHIQQTMLIRSNPFAKFLIGDVNAWKKQLVDVQDVLEEWSKAQRGWCYLWPIFRSEDIQEQLPQVAEQFAVVDRAWQEHMTTATATPTVMEACGIYKTGVLETLQSANTTMDKVVKQLNEYIKQKQLLFSRFFFLSNDDLLHMLSQTKEPLRVQEHLNKCFEGIKSLDFEPGTLLVRGMYSALGEYITFKDPVNPFGGADDEPGAKKSKPEEKKAKATGKQAVRPLERWLSDVEAQMQLALRSRIVQAVADYDVDNQEAWIYTWPQQIILAADQILWTKNVEAAIERPGDKHRQVVWQQEKDKLSQLVEYIKRTRGSGREKVKNNMMLESLIVMGVHTVDVTEEVLINHNVERKAEFEWIKQMRHYVTEEKVPKNPQLRQTVLKISMINSVRTYGLEYQGNQTRLVVTPLTDRCYRTLMGALKLYLGGAPEGPAGTGKTETTKDLAKALAMQCLVFNCSDQLDIGQMGKFFRGLAVGGAWACFDEFNRIETEVLSVIAEQVLLIQNSLQQAGKRNSGTAELVFDEDTLNLNSNCSIFITMNPGYAGRSELPDNLKALFRPVAMMVPNYALIAEIQLYSYGFQNARALSIKIQQSLKLSSEQLSTQTHYDYGMRAVKSIILAAGVLKRNEPDTDESELCLRAICNCNVPKFVRPDIPLFQGIISDLFPTTNQDLPADKKLQDCIFESMESQGLQQNDEFNAKVLQLHETILVRHGLMMVGAAMSAKTSILNTLAQAYTLYLNDGSKVVQHVMNPKSVSIGALYGDFEKVTKDWHDGILALAVREAAMDKMDDKHWILLDGPVDAVWIENMNTVLDDNKKLCLSSGEMIKLTEYMTMMFEVEDLKQASPATVSRCGMVYVSADNLGWEVQVQSWVKRLPGAFKQKGVEAMYPELIQWFVPGVMQFLYGNQDADDTIAEEARVDALKGPVPVAKNELFRGFLNLLESLLFGDETRETLYQKELVEMEKVISAQETDALRRSDDDIPKVSKEPSKTARKAFERPYWEIMTEQELNTIIQKFLMACIWGFGAHLEAKGRVSFNAFMQDQIYKFMGNLGDEDSTLSFRKKLDWGCVPSTEQNLFNQYYKGGDHRWGLWSDDINKYNIKGEKELDDAEKQRRAEADYNTNVNSVEEENEESGSDIDNKIEVDEEGIEYNQIMVATADSISNDHILNLLISHEFPMILVGGTGTGKTRQIKRYVGSLLGMHMSKWESGEMVLSATESAANLFKYTMSKMDKHKKGLYGPKTPQNKLIMFIDDLSMPAQEKYGAQPPLELIRQMIGQGGYYSMKDMAWLGIKDLVFVGAMGLPGGARTLPSARLLRYFNVLNVSELSLSNQKHIFGQILEWGFRDHDNVWKQNIRNVVQFILDVYGRTTQALLPLPGKQHYVFNLRQVSEVVQGVLNVPAKQIDSSAEDNNAKLAVLKRLVVHECMRVFSDRLTNPDDKQLFVEKCLALQERTASNTALVSNFDVPHPSELFFCNFVRFEPADPAYEEATSVDKLKETLETIMHQYNKARPVRERMGLLLFDYFLQHLAHVSRIISKPSGHGLLISLGSKGRRTATKIAAFCNGAALWGVELRKGYGPAEWREDLRALFKSLGIDNKKTVFAFNDKQIAHEAFVEDINSILNVGELTSLFSAEDLEEIEGDIRYAHKKLKQDPLELFSQQCKRNLHVMLSFDPTGHQLELYFRKYPSLVNCTTIDWYLPWPKEALMAVSTARLLPVRETIHDSVRHGKKEQGDSPAKQKITASGHNTNKIKVAKLEPIAEGVERDTSMKKVRRDNGAAGGDESSEGISEIMSEGSGNSSARREDERQRQQEEDEHQRIASIPLDDRIAEVLATIHTTALKLTQKYASEKNRQVYVTPANYQQIFPCLVNLLERRTKSIEAERTKYAQGIIKLGDATEHVKEMQITLGKLQPVLDAKSKEVDELMKQLKIEQKEVAEVQVEVDAETAIVEEQKRQAEIIKADCDAELQAALPLYEEATKALKSLKPADFVLLNAMQHPPGGVRLALEGACIMLDEKPVIVSKNGVKTKDYWTKSLKIMKNHKKFVERLEKYDKNSLEPRLKKQIETEYMVLEDYTPEKIRHASEAAEGICKWTIALVKYDTVYQGIVPKRKAADQAQADLQVILDALAVKQKELADLEEKRNKLQELLEAQQEEKRSLLEQRDDAQRKLERAQKITGSIGSERERWIEMQEKLSDDMKSLLGDSILATAFVVYLGPYEGSYRTDMMYDWQKLVLSFQIYATPNFNLSDTLGNEEQLADWQMNGIPQDNISVDNMIIIEETRRARTPLIIDPQGQAVAFMRENMGGQNNHFITVKISEARAVDQLEACIQRGGIAICENAGNVTHPALTAILAKVLNVAMGETYITFNDKQIPYDEDFQLYIFSELSNAHFNPDVQQLAAIVNFTVTESGLEQQLLSVVCKCELKKEEEERVRMRKDNIVKDQLKKKTMNDMLEQLLQSGDDILESDSLVDTLETSSKMTIDITATLENAKNIEKKIEDSRKIFKPVANQGARLYFALQDIAVLDPMYRYSMSWFQNLFIRPFLDRDDPAEPEEPKNSESGNKTDRPGGITGRDLDASFVSQSSQKSSQRGQSITNNLRKLDAQKQTKEVKLQKVRFYKSQFREILYREVCMGMYDKHKSLFAFFMAIRIFEDGKQSGDTLNAQNLNALQRVEEMHKRTTQLTSTIGRSVGTKSKQVSANLDPTSVRKSVVSRSRRSDSIADGGQNLKEVEQRLKAEKEEMRLKVDKELLQFMLTGMMPQHAQMYQETDSPRLDLFPAKMWHQVCQLTAFEQFENLVESIEGNLEAWERFMQNETPNQFDLLPSPFQEHLPHFCWLPLIRILKPEQTLNALKRYIKRSLGDFFVTPLIFNLRDAFDESDVSKPLLLMLTPGNDPMDAIKKIGKECNKIFYSISLGKGQDVKAKKLIRETRTKENGGGWVVLQNCHLYSSFLPELEQLIENMQPKFKPKGRHADEDDDDDFAPGGKEEELVDPQFRLWLTSMSLEGFPQTILQNSVKLTSEPPKGIKTSLLRTFQSIKNVKAERDFYEGNTYPERWQPLFLALTFFHGIVRERRRFGPLGWNKFYDFNDSDFNVSKRQLNDMVQEFENVPFEALNYLTGHCNYGGRVTDEQDRLVLTTLLSDFITEKSIVSGNLERYQFAEGCSDYFIFYGEHLVENLDYVQRLPEDESPLLMGLHENAIITQAYYESADIFANILALTKGDSSSQTSEDSPVDTKASQANQIIAQVREKIRTAFKINEVAKKFPFRHDESMNSVLVQELARFNNLIDAVHSTLNTLELTLAGRLVQTQSSEDLLGSLINNQIPDIWLSSSYPSRKNLIGYIDDLKARLDMFENWIATGEAPKVHWISGFFFTHSFLTGVQQNFARKYKVAIDKVKWRFEVMKPEEMTKLENGDPTMYLESTSGCLIKGLFLEGASWDAEKVELREQEHKVLHVPMPVIRFIAQEEKETLQKEHQSENSDHTVNKTQVYSCPVYKTSARSGTLTSTGHSTVYILDVQLNSSGASISHWVKRSTALLCQLDN